MTEETVSTKSTATPAKKAAVKKAAVKKAPAKKPAARKAPARKPRAHTRTPQDRPMKRVFNRLEDSVVAVPLKAANRTFMASLGLLSYVQGELDKQYKAFDRKFDKYARDGEKVLDRFEDRVEDFRKDVEKKVDEARDRVRDTFNKAA